MRFFKFIFSRAFLTFLAILIQVALFYVVIKFFLPWFALFYLISLLIGLSCFLVIINKKEPVEYKLPWFLLLVVPLVGVFMFILYYSPKLTRKESRFLSSLFEEGKKFLSEDDIKNVKNVDLSNYHGVSEYLKRVNQTSGFSNGNTEFFKTGKEYLDNLKQTLKCAKKYVFMQFFIIRPGVMWDEIFSILSQKVSEGVEVRVMLDYVGSFGLPYRFCKKLNKMGISCVKFNKLGLKVSSRYNNRDHRNIVVIDGEIAYTGGINISDEYINVKSRFGVWKDTAVKITGESAKIFAFNFLLLNDVGRKSKSDYKKYLDFNAKSDTNCGFIQPFADGPKPFYSEHVTETNFHNLISSARKKIYITTPYLITDYSMLSALKNASLRGIDVRIITPHIPDKKLIFALTRSNYKFLMDAGVKIYEYTPGFIHSKQMLIDGETAFVGTVNLDYRSMVHHFECGVNLYKTNCIKDIESDFNELFNVSQIAEIPRQSKWFFSKLIMAILNVFSPML